MKFCYFRLPYADGAAGAHQPSPRWETSCGSWVTPGVPVATRLPADSLAQPEAVRCIKLFCRLPQGVYTEKL